MSRSTAIRHMAEALASLAQESDAGDESACRALVRAHETLADGMERRKREERRLGVPRAPVIERAPS